MSTELIESPSRIEPSNLAPAPTIETILANAVEQRVDPANMERIVALFERVQDRRAEQAFNAALLQFKKECPAIVKKGEAYNKSNQLMYRFVTLEELTKVVDPVLSRHGLGYSFDVDVLNEATVVTCTVRHIDGHKQSSKFTCKGSGTPIMNAAQIAASAVTFGKRYSLVNALGVTADLDDDGRRAVPSPAPDHDVTAPKVAPRAERKHVASGEPRVTADQLNDLAMEYARVHKVPVDRIRDEFSAWAQKTTGCSKSMASVSHWTIDSLEVCRQALEEQ